MVIFDTCILIEISRGNELIREKVSTLTEGQYFISVITEFEFLAGSRNKQDYILIMSLLNQFNSLPINDGISELFMKLCKTYALSHKLSVPDMLIASTAIYYDLPLFTLNQKDFQYLPDIKLFN